MKYWNADEMKLMMKFLLCSPHIFSEIWNSGFSLVQGESGLRSQATLYLQFLENAQRTAVHLHWLFWHKVFVHLKLKLISYRISSYVIFSISSLLLKSVPSFSNLQL